MASGSDGAARSGAREPARGRSERSDGHEGARARASGLRGGAGGSAAPRRGGRERGGRPGGAGGAGGERGGRPPSSGGEVEERRGGPRLAPRTGRLPEPAIAEGVTGKELDRSVRAQLRTLSKENAEGVAQHLVMVASLLETDLEAAEAHAETAVRRAGRVPATREALGLVAYRKGEWARALAEFRTVRRLSGSSHLLPLMVDCERGLGRPARALDLAATPEASTLGLDDRVELAIVVSGVRRDLGQLDAAVAALELPQLRSGGARPWRARLFYAYAEARLALGDAVAGRDWFARAVDADHEVATDAAERLEELDGVQQTDLLGETDEPPSHGGPGRAADENP